MAQVSGGLDRKGARDRERGDSGKVSRPQPWPWIQMGSVHPKG